VGSKNNNLPARQPVTGSTSTSNAKNKNTTVTCEVPLLEDEPVS